MSNLQAADAYFMQMSPEEIKAEMAQNLRGKGLDLDMREGSFCDLLLSEAAYQIYKARAYFPTLLAQAIPSDKTGPALDAWAGLYGLTRAPGRYAGCSLTFTGSDGAAIPQGTVCLTSSGIGFATLAACTISGGTASVGAVAQELGETGNVEAGSVTRFLVTLPGVASVSNTKATGGADPESDGQLYGRLHLKLSAPVASGNKNYYRMLALGVAGVGHAAVEALWAGPGTVRVCVASPDREPVDEEVVADVQQVMDVERIIGADVTAASVVAVPLNISAQVTLSPTAPGTGKLQEQLSADLRTYLQRLEVGSAPVIRYTHLLLLLLSLEGVEDYTTMTVNGTTNNVPIAANQVPTVGTITITGG